MELKVLGGSGEARKWETGANLLEKLTTEMLKG
jgi:hypothetical protein